MMQRKQPIIKNGEIFWECPACKKILSSEHFYKSKKTWNHLNSQCKKCHIRGSIKTRDKEKNKVRNRNFMRADRARNPEKYLMRDREASKIRIKDHRHRARQAVRRALNRGKLIKPSECSKCHRKIKLTAHHPDYSKPLEVIWLCYECHGNK